MAVTFKVVVMICAIGQQPQECQPPTARSVFTLENGLTNEIACMREFTMGIAKVGDLYDPEHEYPKLACERVEDERL